MKIYSVLTRYEYEPRIWKDNRKVSEIKLHLYETRSQAIQALKISYKWYLEKIRNIPDIRIENFELLEGDKEHDPQFYIIFSNRKDNSKSESVCCTVIERSLINHDSKIIRKRKLSDLLRG